MLKVFLATAALSLVLGFGLPVASPPAGQNPDHVQAQKDPALAPDHHGAPLHRAL